MIRVLELPYMGRRSPIVLSYWRRSSGPTSPGLRARGLRSQCRATLSPNYVQSPDYVPESDPEADPEEDDDEDPEEDPIDYPADGGDDEEDEDGQRGG
ncbi:hypothetical protein Tco_0128977 [Tanacetum coccineum]